MSYSVIVRNILHVLLFQSKQITQGTGTMGLYQYLQKQKKYNHMLMALG